MTGVEPSMDSGEGVVFTQLVVATGQGRAYTVQHGDQYNYIYRGTPPYRVEPFPFADPGALPTGLAAAPSRLLMARYQVVPFTHRPELDQLEAWREDAAAGLSIRLVHAEGGQGKTRLAAEFAARSAQAGWCVALARHRSEVASAGGGDEHLAVRPPGLVLIVDYADRWPVTDLITLVRQHRDAARDRLRILLLARPAGLWWQDLAHQLAKLEIFDAESVRLQALPAGPTVRSLMYASARDRFAEVFALDDQVAIAEPGDLDDPVFALTLTVHMRALVDVDAAFRGWAPPAGSGQADLSSYLLDRERDYWRSAHDGGQGPVQTTEEVMGRAVFIATLTPPLARADAAEALSRTRVAGTAQDCAALLADHALCYPPQDSGLVLEPLYPDRLGEDYLALTLPGFEEQFGYHATDAWALAAPVRLLEAEGGDPGSARWTRQAMTTLVETARRWPHVTTVLLRPMLAAHPRLALQGGGTTLTNLACLAEVDPAVLETVEDCLSGRRHSDLDVGIAVLAQRVAEHRLSTVDDPAERARIYSNLNLRLSSAGQRDQALAAVEQAVDIRRSLAQEDPGTFTLDYAQSLVHLGIALSDIGRREEALETTQSATELLRRGAGVNPAAFEPDLSRALTNLCFRLSESGRTPEAAEAAQEAVEIRRRLAQADPAEFNSSLALSLNNLSAALSELGQWEEALSATRSALDLQRVLVGEDPAAFGPDLARSLDNLGIRLNRLGSPQEAVAATQEAVDIYRELAKTNPATFTPELARAMANLAAELWATGRKEEAVAAMEEAADQLRRMAATNPAAFEPNLAHILRNLGLMLAGFGRWEDALPCVREALDIRRRFAEANPAAVAPALAKSLSSFGFVASRLGRQDEAVTAAREAVDLFRGLAGQNPVAFEHDLAHALWNAAQVLLVPRTEPREALSRVQEAAAIYRRLADQRPSVFSVTFGGCLGTAAEVLDSLPRPQEARVLRHLIDTGALDEAAELLQETARSAAG